MQSITVIRYYRGLLQRFHHPGLAKGSIIMIARSTLSFTFSVRCFCILEYWSKDGFNHLTAGCGCKYSSSGKRYCSAI